MVIILPAQSLGPVEMFRPCRNVSFMKKLEWDGRKIELEAILDGAAVGNVLFMKKMDLEFEKNRGIELNLHWLHNSDTNKQCYCRASLWWFYENHKTNKFYLDFSLKKKKESNIYKGSKENFNR